jgi:Flp pilus assembly protein TadD
MKAMVLLAGILGMTLLPAGAEDLAHTTRLPADEREIAQAAADDFNAHRYEDAAAKYKAIIAAYSDCLYAWSNLGVVRFQEGHLEEARQALEHALTLQPNNAFDLSNLGIVYYQLGRFEDAKRMLKKAIQVQPYDPNSHNFLAATDEKTGDKDEAATEMEKARLLWKQREGLESLVPGH